MVSSDVFIFTGNLASKKENIIHTLCRSGSIACMRSFGALINTVGRCMLVWEYNSEGQQCAHVAAASPNAEETLELLVQWGADINSQDKCRGDTPLHIAASTRNYGLANWICLQVGSELNVHNFDHKTPWRIAYDQKDLTMMWLLQAHGAICKIPCQEDQTEMQGGKVWTKSQVI